VVNVNPRLGALVVVLALLVTACGSPEPDPVDSLELVAADPSRTATEGPTLAKLDGEWRLLASDGRDGPRERRMTFPVFDLALEQVGTLDAPYPTNLPWPSIVETDSGWALVMFDGTRAGGDLVGYGTHGDVVVATASR
jgi:hypothetical protein